VGAVAAEQITPYPPGIPAIVQGNRINTAIIDYLCSGFEAGMVIPDSAYPNSGNQAVLYQPQVLQAKNFSVGQKRQTLDRRRRIQR
jgi:arginine/lysine/ornithine decarboxylase